MTPAAPSLLANRYLVFTGWTLLAVPVGNRGNRRRPRRVSHLDAGTPPGEGLCGRSDRFRNRVRVRRRRAIRPGVADRRDDLSVHIHRGGRRDVSRGNRPRPHVAQESSPPSSDRRSRSGCRAGVGWRNARARRSVRGRLVARTEHCGGRSSDRRSRARIDDHRTWETRRRDAGHQAARIAGHRHAGCRGMAQPKAARAARRRPSPVTCATVGSYRA